MSARTFVIGDIHGDLDHLRKLIEKLPLITRKDTVVFLGDYVDRGPRSREVVRVVRALDLELGCNVVALRGNHEDAWLRVIDQGWPEFVMPPNNGCLATFRSYRAPDRRDVIPDAQESEGLFRGAFFPPDVIEWMRSLPLFHEDEHGIYVHAGLIEKDGKFLHPSETEPPTALLWTRSKAFFHDYDGKLVVIGHTATDLLPQELSKHTPEDPTDMWVSDHVIAIDTQCGKGGFLTAVELPSLAVYESR